MTRLSFDRLERHARGAMALALYLGYVLHNVRKAAPSVYRYQINPPSWDPKGRIGR